MDDEEDLTGLGDLLPAKPDVPEPYYQKTADRHKEDALALVQHMQTFPDQSTVPAIRSAFSEWAAGKSDDQCRNKFWTIFSTASGRTILEQLTQSNKVKGAIAINRGIEEVAAMAMGEKPILKGQLSAFNALTKVLGGAGVVTNNFTINVDNRRVTINPKDFYMDGEQRIVHKPTMDLKREQSGCLYNDGGGCIGEVWRNREADQLFSAEEDES